MLITGIAQRDAWERRDLPPVEPVRPGVWSIPVPIPHNPLRYTLCYAFTGDAGIVLVDPGWDTPEGRAALKAGLAAAGADVADVSGVLVTHVHFDHHGMSGWLREQTGAWVGMHPAEAASLPARAWRDRPRGADRGWLRLAGVPEAELDDLEITQGRLDELKALAEPDRLFEDGELIPVAGRELRAVWTPGHTPGHLCLHDAEAGILLTGDHLLPRISPNIGVHDKGDPLTDYLASLAEIRRFEAEEALPAHEYRFRGIAGRADELLGHHGGRNAEIIRTVGRPGEWTAYSIAAALTWSRGWEALRALLRRLALAETIAHLNHLRHVGLLVSKPTNPIEWSLTKP